MTHDHLTDEELLAYLDEMLPVETLGAIEAELRASEELRRRLSDLLRRRDHGVHSVGEMWRRARLSCPSRTQLGSYLLGTLDPAEMEYIEFHLTTIGCRICHANLVDLQESAREPQQTQQRRQRIFQSSAGYLRRDEA